MSRKSPNLFSFLAAGVWACAAAGSAQAQANLVPQFNASTGHVTVQNTVDDPAAATWVTIECNGDCPEPPPAQLAPYLNPGFANKLSIQVPALAGGQSFQHNVAFWNALVFPAGVANFTVCADASGLVREISERDNCIQVSHRQRGPKVKIPVPSPRLRLKN